MYCRLLHHLVVKKWRAAEDLIWTMKVVFAEFGLPKLFVSDGGTDFV